MLDRLLNPHLMSTRLAALCVSAPIATRPNHIALVIRVVDQFLLVVMAFFIMIGPEVDTNAVALGFFVDFFVAYQRSQTNSERAQWLCDGLCRQYSPGWYLQSSGNPTTVSKRFLQWLHL